MSIIERNGPCLIASNAAIHKAAEGTATVCSCRSVLDLQVHYYIREGVDNTNSIKCSGCILKIEQLIYD